MKKYYKVFYFSIKNSLTYITDFIAGNIFLLLIIFIYVVLWKNLYAADIKTGFTFPEMIWYLIINECVFTNNSDLFRQVDKDIKSGGIAYHLNKPYSYPVYILFDSLGKSSINFVVCSAICFGIGIFFVGMLPSLNIVSFMPILIMMFLGIVLNLLIYILLSLTSFWFEENRPFIWIYRQFVFAFGGFLVPITLFPKFIYSLTLHMPWTYVAYHTSLSCVKFSFENFASTVSWQIGYIAAISAIIAVLYRKGVKSLNVNGG